MEYFYIKNSKIIKSIFLLFKKNILIKIFFILEKLNLKNIYGDWGLGIGDWGLGIGDWAQSPIPNPQSPIPNPQFYLEIKNKTINLKSKFKILIFTN